MADAAPLVFALEGSRAFGLAVVRELGLDLAEHEERNFEDGEHKARPLAGVAGRDVYLIHSLYGEPGHSGNDKLCRMLFFIGALRDAGAARVTAVAPYLAYARKDRRTQPGDPVTTRYLAALFEAVGTDAIVTLEVHNPAAYQNAFRCRAEQVDGTALLLPWVASLLGDSDAVVVSPDAGGSKRVELFRRALTAQFGRPFESAWVAKFRSGGEVSGDTLVGEVRGLPVVLLDDMIATGTTLLRAARACKAAGAGRVLAAASHGLFAGDAARLLADPAIDRIAVSDSIGAAAGRAAPLGGKVSVLACAPLFAAAIQRMHGGD